MTMKLRVSNEFAGGQIGSNICLQLGEHLLISSTSLILSQMFTGGGCPQQWQDPRLRLQQPMCPGLNLAIDEPLMTLKIQGVQSNVGLALKIVKLN